MSRRNGGGGGTLAANPAIATVKRGGANGVRIGVVKEKGGKTGEGALFCHLVSSERILFTVFPVFRMMWLGSRLVARICNVR